MVHIEQRKQIYDYLLANTNSNYLHITAIVLKTSLTEKLTVSILNEFRYYGLVNKKGDYWRISKQAIAASLSVDQDSLRNCFTNEGTNE